MTFGRSFALGAVMVQALLANTFATADPTPQTVARVSKNWKRATAGDIEVVGPVPAAALRGSLDEIATFRDVFRALYPTLRVTWPTPTRVVVFPDLDALSRFGPRDSRGRPQQNLGGYFTAEPDLNLIALGGPARELMYHEFAHYILLRNLHSLPGWLSEGLAEFYSTFEVDHKKGTVVIGRPPMERMRGIRSLPFLPLEKVVLGTGDEMSRLWRDPQGISMFYAESWGLVHYLMLGRQGSTPGAFGQFLQGIERGKAVPQALQEAFGTDVAQLEKDLRRYLLQRVSYPAVSFELRTTVASDSSVQPMAEADARYVQGDLLVRAGAASAAQEELAAALAIDPAHTGAKIAFARAQLQLQHRSEGIASLKEVVDASPASFAGAYYLASALSTDWRHEEALQLYSRALGLNSESAHAWMGLSVAALALGRTSQANASMTHVMHLHADPAWYRVRAYAALGLGLDGTAASDARQYIDLVGWSSESATYTGFIAAIAYLRLHQPEEARQMLEGARATTAPDSWTMAVIDFLQSRVSAGELLAKARSNGEKTEAHAYIGFKDEIDGHSEEALTHFQWVADEGAHNYYEYEMARLELKRLHR
jgi:tetratricopeptide (TPR) repeat protein